MSGFRAAAEGFSRIANEADFVASELPEPHNFEGAAAEVFGENLLRNRTQLSRITDNGLAVAEICVAQTYADSDLLEAPSEGEVEAARQRALSAARVAEMSSNPALVRNYEQFRDEYLELKAERDAALMRHETATLETKQKLEEIVWGDDGVQMFGEGDEGEDAPRKWTEDDLYNGDPSLDDIQQTTMNDCYLAAVMGAIANTNPEFVRNMITYDEETGNFYVKLYTGPNDVLGIIPRHGEWIQVEVSQEDIRKNISMGGMSRIDDGVPSAALWPAVVESAYVEIIGSDGSPTPPGNATNVFERVTGHSGDYRLPNPIGGVSAVGEQISDAIASGRPVVISANSEVGNGLSYGHTYVVKGIDGDTVTLSNPLRHNLNGFPSNPGGEIVVTLGQILDTFPGKAFLSEFVVIGRYP